MGTETHTRPVPSWRVTDAAVLLAILGIAFFFRFYVNNSGLPGEVFPRNDELNYSSRVVDCLSGDWNVNYFINPSLYIFLVAAAGKIAGSILVCAGEFSSFDDFVLLESLNAYHVTMIGRVLSISLASLSAALVFLIARRMYSTRVGLLAALALAVNSVHCSRSPLLGNEVTMVFLVLSFFLLLLQFMDSPTISRHVVCGLVLGMAVSTKYNAGLHVATFVVGTLAVAFPLKGESRVRLASPAAWAGFPAVAVGFLAGSPSILWNFASFCRQFGRQSSFLHHGWLPADRFSSDSGWRFYVEAFPRENNGLIFGVLCAVGLVLAISQILKRRDTRGALLVTAIVPFYLLLGSGVFLDMRFLLPAIPFALILGAVVLDELIEWIERRLSNLRPIRGRAWKVVMAATAVGVTTAVFFSHALTTRRLMFERDGQIDSRFYLVQWLRDNLDSTATYVVLAKPPMLRLLDRNEALRGVPPAIRDRDSEAIRSVMLGFEEMTFDYVDLEPLIARSDSLEGLQKRLVGTGARSVLVILPRSLFNDLVGLQMLSRSTAIQDCTYWGQLVEGLEPVRSAVFSHGNVMAATYQIPIGEPRPLQMP